MKKTEVEKHFVPFWLVVALLISGVSSAVLASYVWPRVTIPFEVTEPIEILDYTSELSLFPGETRYINITVQNHATISYNVTLDFRLDDSAYQAAYVTFSDEIYTVASGQQNLTAWTTVASYAPAITASLTIDIRRVDGTLSSYEDFAAYIEVNPYSSVSVTSTRITVSKLTRAEGAYVFRDKGSGHFSGDFEHLLDIHPISCGQDWGLYYVWALFNVAGAVNEIGTSGNNGVSIFVCRHIDDSLYICLREFYDGHKYDKATHGVCCIGWDETYYLTIKRVGSTLECKIYDDSARTSLLDSLTLTLHTVDSYRYIYGTSSDGVIGHQQFHGYIENLNLQETS